MSVSSEKIKRVLFNILLCLICLAVCFWTVSLFTTNRVVYRFDSLSVASWIVVVLTSIALFVGVSVLKKHKNYFKELIHIFPSETSIDYLHLCLSAVIFFVFYMLILMSDLCDYPKHTFLASNFDFTNFFKSLDSISDPLWHLLSFVSSRILNITINYTASVVSALFFFFTYSVTRKIIFSIAVNAKREIVDILSFALMFVQPIYAPWFNVRQYFGQGTPNIWHNPTNLAVRPFSLLYLYLLYQMIHHWNDDDKHILNLNTVRLFVLNLISVLAKPSHAQVAIPATGVILLYLLLDSKGKSFRFSLRIVLTWVPAVLWAGFIFYNSFINSNTNEGNGIALSVPPFDVWRNGTPSVPISILLIAGLPLFILAFFLFKKGGKSDKNKYLFMTFVFFVVAILEHGYLVETGSRRYDGNFGWGYMLALSQIWVYSSGYFLDDITNGDSEAVFPKIARKTVVFFIALHVLFGIRYFIHCYQGFFD